MGVMLTMLRERRIQRGRGLSIFPLQQGEEGARSPLLLRPHPTGPPGRSPDVKLRPPPSLSLHGNQQSFQETRERQRAARCHRMLQWRRADSLRSLKQREREREERLREFDLLQPWEVTKILRNLMILVHITMNASGSFIITLMVV